MPPYTLRATQIFEAKRPEGPFLPIGDKLPATPTDEMALDGTLWVENGRPYMVYCHEWVQIGDGAMKTRGAEKRSVGPRGATRDAVPRLGRAMVDGQRRGRQEDIRHRRLFPLPHLDGQAADALVELHERRVRHRHSRIDHGTDNGSVASPPRASFQPQRRPRHGVPRIRRRIAARDPRPQLSLGSRARPHFSNWRTQATRSNSKNVRAMIPFAKISALLFAAAAATACGGFSDDERRIINGAKARSCACSPPPTATTP